MKKFFFIEKKKKSYKKLNSLHCKGLTKHTLVKKPADL